MENQYWVGDHFVDLSRNQVIRAEQTLTLQPKALAVLTFLAQHQGEVVSHDTLMENIWTDSVVSPNSLQRIIAQLRKALGDDSKTQAIIQTHAKKGYSLECPVRWEPASFKPLVQVKSRAKLSLVMVLLVLTLTAVLWPAITNNYDSDDLVFNKLTPVTASDEKELTPSYSPDGKYIVFHRYNGLCINNLWAKDLATQQETQLTKSDGSYHSHSFSADGKQLLFTSSVPCGQPQRRTCRQVMALDFAAALTNAQEPTLKIDCEKGDMTDPFLLGNGHTAVLQQQGERWKLVSYSPQNSQQPQNPQSTDLFTPDDHDLYNMNYSVKRDIFTVMGVRKDGEHILTVLSVDGETLSSAAIVRPADFSKLRYIYQSIVPNANKVVFAASKRLFSLSFDGEIKQISAPISQFVYQPKFNPSGDKMVVSQGVFDSDIATIDLNKSPAAQNAVGFNQVFTPYPSIARSTFAERDGQFKPDSTLASKQIAFLSNRSGTYQVWLALGNTTRQLSQFETDTIIKGLAWHDSDDRLMVSANNGLYQVTLDNITTKIAVGSPVERPVDQVFHWHKDNLLLNVQIDGLLKLARYNLATGQLTLLADTGAQYATMTQSNQLVFKDTKDVFWQEGPQGPEPIESLTGKTDTFRFVEANDVIFGVDKGGLLWSYDLTTKVHKTLRQLDKHVSYISAIKQQQLLVTQTISARKEIFQLSRTAH
ncbi:MAG: winged helix-turn-helix domain-containing protein [Psychrosphaera sp.]|nr:winged helix-turn-helix domain-containing protein [Psychrosphaera sp.]